MPPPSCCFLLSLFRHRAQGERLIKKQSLITTEIKIPVLPYEEYLWVSTPYQGTEWEERYKLFYQIDTNVKFITIPHEEWTKIKK